MIKKWVGIFCFIFTMVTTVVWAKPDSAYIDNEFWGDMKDARNRLSVQGCPIWSGFLRAGCRQHLHLVRQYYNLLISTI